MTELKKLQTSDHKLQHHTARNDMFTTPLSQGYATDSKSHRNRNQRIKKPLGTKFGRYPVYYKKNDYATVSGIRHWLKIPPESTPAPQKTPKYQFSWKFSERMFSYDLCPTIFDSVPLCAALVVFCLILNKCGFLDLLNPYFPTHWTWQYRILVSEISIWWSWHWNQ